MILSVVEDWSGLIASSQAEGKLQNEACVRVFTVEFDNGDIPAIRPLLARDHYSIPAMWDSHPYQTWLYVDHKEVYPNGGPFSYKVTIFYVSDPEPLAQEPKISWNFATSSEPIDRDINDDPILNSANESYDPAIAKEVADLILRIERNEETFDKNKAHQFKDSINADSFWGFNPGKVRCTIFDGYEDRVAWLNFWRVTYEFQIRRDGWKRRILDQGFRIKDGTDSDGKPQYKICADTNDNPLSQPVLLDGLGGKLADGATPIFKEYDIYPQETFALLGLG